MEKKPIKVHPAEWTGVVEIVFQKASLRAYSENFFGKKEISYEEFKKETLSYTGQFVDEQCVFIANTMSKAKPQEFRIWFNIVKSRLEKEENMQDVENIIREWHNKLLAKLSEEK